MVEIQTFAPPESIGEDLDGLVADLAAAGQSVSSIGHGIQTGRRRGRRLVPAEAFNFVLHEVEDHVVSHIVGACVSAFITWARRRFRRNKLLKYVVIVGPDGRPLKRVLMKSTEDQPVIEELTDWPDPPALGGRGL